MSLVLPCANVSRIGIFAVLVFASHGWIVMIMCDDQGGEIHQRYDAELDHEEACGIMGLAGTCDPKDEGCAVWKTNLSSCSGGPKQRPRAANGRGGQPAREIMSTTISAAGVCQDSWSVSGNDV